MLSEAENVMDYVPVCYLFALVPLLMVVSVPGAVDSAVANNQFRVYRVHQIDLPHGTFGSRNSVFNLEAITPGHLSDSFVRKCALFKLTDLLKAGRDYDLFLDKVLSQSLVSAVLIIFKDLKTTSLTQDETHTLQLIEKSLLTNETSLPIYLVEENDEINQLYAEYSQTKEAANPSLYDFLMKNVFFDSHQFVVTGPQTTSINNAVITSLQAKLVGAGIEDQLPTYAIVAHYDSYSVVPGLSFGADSNASGLIILLELLRVFSKLYASPKTKPKANLLFYISGAGKLNYFGTRKWLDDNLDSSHSATSTLFENFQFAACLDSLADSGNNGLFKVFVSKPPKPTSPAGVFWENLNEIANRYYPSVNASQQVKMVHQKINLAEDSLAWEHEQFSLRRMSAFTLSNGLPRRKKTLSDVYRESYVKTLEINANIIGEALARQLYGAIEENMLQSEFAVSHSFIKSLFEHVANIPRAQQLLLTTPKGNSFQLPPLLSTLQTILKKYSNSHIKLLHHKLDGKIPEFVFYDPVTTKMNIYNMKPAMFDFIITSAITIYLAFFYLIVKNFKFLTFNSNNSENNNAKAKSK